MKRTTLVFALALSLAASSGAGAQEFHPFRASALLGFGGSLDSDHSSGLANSSFQIGFSFETEKDTAVGFRYARLDFDDGLNDDGFGSADLSYLTVAGEYSFSEGYYQSGLYLGIGAYKLGTTGPLGLSDDDTGIGATVGVTGEFAVARHFAVLVELSGHWADLDAINLFGLGHVGVAYRW